MAKALWCCTPLLVASYVLAKSRSTVAPLGECPGDGSSLLQVKSAAGRVGPARTAATPRTLLWNPTTLVSMRGLIRSNPPAWATKALANLVKAADRRVDLKANIRPGVPEGPWSLTQNVMRKPENDQRNFMSYKTYAWPCDYTCADAKAEQPKLKKSCTSWKAYTGVCNADGTPWVGHDGFGNPAGSLDAELLVVMIDTLELLTLSWWFTNSEDYASAAMEVFRTWFVNNSTRMNPHLKYAAQLPGASRTPSLISPSHRWNSKLNDCVALLQTQGNASWTARDEAAWKSWSAAWLEWWDASEAGKNTAKKHGNHATWYFVHKLAMAHALGREDIGTAIVGGLRAMLPGSFVEQIEPSGEMPHESKRVAGVSYSLMNLEGLISLGIMVQRVCADWTCNTTFDWAQESEALEGCADPASGCAWRVSKKVRVTNCKHVGNAAKADTIAKCHLECFRDADCNAAQWRDSKKKCEMKTCSGELEFEADPRREVHVYTPPRAGGRGSLKNAVEYLLQFANGTEDWLKYHNTTDRTNAVPKNWARMALFLRMITANFAASASYYEEQAKMVDTGFATDWHNLLFRPSTGT
eukprot:TRINITY_DN55774_c0_g1_i1.p1 TRINITY_DN55774_c0_g1~~TRINITY_DN55774_c0_g1_i1.p1  ORF type:complete len:583 (-),score=78.81 TRINITY_DN55774_c0_g1_i1:129-1877(-)